MMSTIMVDEFIPFLHRKIGVAEQVLKDAYLEFMAHDCDGGESARCNTDKNETEAPTPVQSLKRPVELSPPPQPSSPSSPDTYTVEQLSAFKIAELKVICERLRITKTGTKAQLSNNIIAASQKRQKQLTFTPPTKKQRTDDASDVHASCSDTEMSSNGIKGSGCDPKQNSDGDCTKKVGKLQLDKYRQPDVAIVKNQYGHLIHDETKIVFSSDENYIDGVKCRMAIGYEDEDGHVEALTAEKIEQCNQYCFKYIEPSVIVS